ncbi:DegT/DnrJ/EryC1/StrS family aminotransferase [Candidatus Saccharibacteria bacterium]|nr:DegT/DnrJ/EryC1/StrS family aminotransferase [Candidatus Saccharibacteria bacterium]
MLFLGLASNYAAKDILRHSFILGTKKHYHALERALSTRYGASLANTSLIYSGRSAIAIALKSFIASGRLKKGDHVAINGFTCYAVVQAITHAKLVSVYLDIEPNSPNYSAATLKTACQSDKKLKCFILQNTFGMPVNIESFSAVKKEYNLLCLEDLAHCAGRYYQKTDGSHQEIGTFGEATCLSFGKGKAIDTITGGAVLLRDPSLSFPKSFQKSTLVRRQKTGDVPRASWYPIFGATARGLAHLHLEKPFLALLLKLRFIERSADTKLLENTTITCWQARLALRQLQNLKSTPLRNFCLVSDKAACLSELQKSGFRLEESWYDTPVAPARYYKKLNYPESSCPNSVYFASHVINLPTWYHSPKKRAELSRAKSIIKYYEVK